LEAHNRDPKPFSALSAAFLSALCDKSFLLAEHAAEFAKKRSRL
jgi:hypothetical protein